MSWAYRNLIRPALFTRDSEEIHNRTLRTLGWIARRALLCEALASFYRPDDLPVDLFGLSFPNPVGLAAGMDKQAEAAPAWEAFGFGFAELGGVTWHAQPGNPAPRMFRIVPDKALINRMGFNNPGAEALAGTLAAWRARGRWPRHPVGVNLGKSKVTPLENAPEDYANSFRRLWAHGDFFVVNVSSPNTPNLRQLQDRKALDEILAALQEVNAGLGSEVQGPGSGISSPGSGAGEGAGNQLSVTSHQSGGVGERSSVIRDRAAEPGHGQLKKDDGQGRKPILVKVAPDLSFEALDEILELVAPRQVAGLVATNTTLERPPRPRPGLERVYAEAGGLSGRPLRERSTEIIRHLHRQSRGTLPVIGVGGIFNADDAWEKITAGAALLQLYTGLVYEGPAVVKSIVNGLRARLEAGGFRSLKEAVGIRG